MFAFSADQWPCNRAVTRRKLCRTKDTHNSIKYYRIKPSRTKAGFSGYPSPTCRRPPSLPRPIGGGSAQGTHRASRGVPATDIRLAATGRTGPASGVRRRSATVPGFILALRRARRSAAVIRCTSCPAEAPALPGKTVLQYATPHPVAPARQKLPRQGSRLQAPHRLPSAAASPGTSRATENVSWSWLN